MMRCLHAVRFSYGFPTKHCKINGSHSEVPSKFFLSIVLSAQKLFMASYGFLSNTFIMGYTNGYCELAILLLVSSLLLSKLRCRYVLPNSFSSKFLFCVFNYHLMLVVFLLHHMKSILNMGNVSNLPKSKRELCETESHEIAVS